MIHRVSANRPTFNSVDFMPGLNVVVAERSAAATQKDTRNGLGKSTLIEIIDFCLGSNATKGKGLCIEPLIGWEFTLDLSVGGRRVLATRSTEAPNEILIEGETSGWMEQPKLDGTNKRSVLALDQWRRVLGWAFFGLASIGKGRKYKPTYRSLVSYFVRQGLSAYEDPFSHHRRQKAWDSRLHVAFLLGLNWEYAARWQELKDQEDALKAISDAIKTGAVEGALGSVGELEAERVHLEEEVKRGAEALDSFKVHPQYEEIQREADRATKLIHELVNRNLEESRNLSRYRDSVSEEQSPHDQDLVRVFEEARVLFPDAVKKTLADARAFHGRIVGNRRAFLETEIRRLEASIAARTNEIESKTSTRSSMLEVLRTHGALQEMSLMQGRQVETRERLERVRTRIAEIRENSSRRRDVRVAKEELSELADRDHEERRELWSKAVRLFNDNSQALYETPGRLIIDIGDTGFKYSVEIERSGSEGIGKMKVFCFDLMLLELARDQSRAIDFLIHDSLLYDGVDSRQRAQALERAAHVTESLGAQYICALNSDEVPHGDFSEGFDFERHIRLVLRDRDPSDSLLGVQFERPMK